MRSIKYKIVTAAVALTCLLSIMMIGFAQAGFHELVYSNALEANSSYLMSVAEHVNAEVDKVVQPSKILANVIRDMPLMQQSTTTDVRIEDWQKALSPYIVDQFKVSSPTESLTLYLMDGSGNAMPQCLILKDANQNGYLDSPVTATTDWDPTTAETLLRGGKYTDGLWLTSGKHHEFKRSEKIYWRLALPIYPTGENERPSAILLLKGPFSLFSPHFPTHPSDTNPALALYEPNADFLSKTDFFPFNDLTEIEATVGEELTDPGSKTNYQLKQLVDSDGTEFTLLSKKMNSGWTLLYAFPSERFTSAYQKNGQFAWLIAGLFVLITSIFILRFADYLEMPINDLIHQLDSTTRASLALKVSDEQQRRGDELGILMRAFVQLSQELNNHRNQLLISQRQLEEQVNEKNEALTQVHKLLSESIERLHEQEETLQALHNRLNRNLQAIELTQHQLIRQEKTSSLKFLASGVAHELNTPIGNAITLASFTEHELKALASALADVPIKDTTALTNRINGIQDAWDQLSKNIKHANQIISLLEAMIPEDSEVSTETFFLAEFLDRRLTQMLSQATMPIALEVQCDPALQVTTDPNQLAMLLMPLVQNSLDHGFGQLDRGSIKVTVTPQQAGYLLVYEDNGLGIDPVNRPHILTPFFTTRLGRHKGLGLNLAYNIASYYFKGYIEVVEKVQPGIQINCYLQF